MSGCSDESGFLDGFTRFDHTGDLPSGFVVFDGFDDGDCQTVLIGAGLPADDVAGNDRVGAAAGTSTGGVEDPMADDVEHLAAAQLEAFLLDELVGAADRGYLLVQWQVDVLPCGHVSVIARLSVRTQRHGCRPDRNHVSRVDEGVRR
jgi:hypothetical protein